MLEKSENRGFTLLEVMIAVAILAIALVAVFQSQSQSISMAGNARFLTTASLLAQGRMVEMEAIDMAGLSSGSGDFGEDYPDYVWRVEVTDTDLDFMKKIEVKVTNERLVSNNTYRLILYRLITK
jgi:general secretion pathway protein I